MVSGSPSRKRDWTNEREPRAYPAIEDYAVIGDCRTAALVSRDGAIDWLCLPHFSGTGLFAALLDQRLGGSFSIKPVDDYTATRRYLPESNVLETTFTSTSGSARVVDCLPIPTYTQRAHLIQPQRELLRVIEGVDDEIVLEIRFEPRPNFAQSPARLESRGALGWACLYDKEAIFLYADRALTKDPSSMCLSGRVTMRAGEKSYLSMAYEKGNVGVIPPLQKHAHERVEDTLRWWRSWSKRCTYDGPYAEKVLRSALVLKLLTYSLSGAVVAAPTASLPESIGGVRNWDYRYCWLRDASLTLRAFMDLGFNSEGNAFFEWLLHATRLTWPQLQVLYDVYGETDVREVELDHLQGYRDSRPVRIGNAAHRQLQLDLYGNVILAAFDYVNRGGHLDFSEKRMLVGFGKTICRQWQRPDHGIWELRGKPRHNTYSKLMCWTGLDRLVKLHQGGHIKKMPAERFTQTRDEIRTAIETRAWDEGYGGFASTFGGDTVDASLLLIPRAHFLDARDPRMRATYQRIRRELGQNGLLRRYPRGYDDLPGSEGAFGICSFWAVEYLARCGEVAEAERHFAQLMGYANDVGLYAEEFDPEDGGALGNFPQAFTHVGLIGAALALTEARKKGRCTS